MHDFSGTFYGTGLAADIEVLQYLSCPGGKGVSLVLAVSWLIHRLPLLAVVTGPIQRQGVRLRALSD